jgi:hypothetical protein
MKRTELARALNGVETRIPKHLAAQAARDGLVIVTGPYVHLQGAIEGESLLLDDDGNSMGGTVYFDAKGVLPDYHDIESEDEAESRAYFDRKRMAASIDAIAPRTMVDVWSYSTIIPHSTFVFLDDGAPFCKGIVFSLADAGLHVDA